MNSPELDKDGFLPLVDLDDKPGEEKLELSDQQKLDILNMWNVGERPPTLKDLCKCAWKEDIDTRSKKGRLVRDFLASRKLKPTLATDYIPTTIEFTQFQKEYILRSFRSKSATEMAREMFNNPKLHSASAEVRSIVKFIESFDQKSLVTNSDIKSASGQEDEYGEEYRPPKSLSRIISKINEYAYESLEMEKLTARQKKDIMLTMGFLHTRRFLAQMNSYQTEDEKKLFESSFIKWVWNKASDLSQENVDQYIICATEVVISHNIQKTFNMLQREQDGLVEAGERMSMTLVEAINTARREYNESVKRQQSLFKSLDVERSERISNQVRENASILNLVAVWKDAEMRKKMIRYEQMKQKALKEEIKNYMDMPEIRARILGIGENEILNG